MATTRDDIRRWYAEGKRQKATHLVVVCDTFELEDFPVYVRRGQDPMVIVQRYRDADKMVRVMEVYKLSEPIEPQLAKDRCFNI